MIARTYPVTDIPELTDSQIEDIFRNLDMQFNQTMLSAGAHASRNSIQSPGRPRFLIFIILLLYLLATVHLYYGWAVEIAYATLPNGENFWTAFECTPGTPIFLALGIDAILSTILADATLIWRCWIVWGRSWRIVLVPIACTTLATGTFFEFILPIIFELVSLFFDNVVNWAVLYSSLILTTLLWCTILIIYRIWRVGGAAGRIHVYQRVIEMLVESASLYSAVLVVLVVLEARNELAAGYVEEVTSAMRGIIPTILVGRVAAGHARPDDSWNENATMSSLRFRSHSSSQNDSQMSAEPGQDTSFPHIRQDLEQGLEDGTELRVEGAPLTLSSPGNHIGIMSVYETGKERSDVFWPKTLCQDLKKAVRKDKRERMHNDVLSFLYRKLTATSVKATSREEANEADRSTRCPYRSAVNKEATLHQKAVMLRGKRSFMAVESKEGQDRDCDGIQSSSFYHDNGACYH
ncbi:hypothetical protein EV421DRAFT_2023600 [Armillaria borealis]|uniref:Uncharacterized protein n=1 Tax=Armillaria borealis TaxID=47425 RepID=A0AA39IZC0_9AGAR|nr:hypothetical protein EV421DRAFT_2023600 [Armillaria borealis]